MGPFQKMREMVIDDVVATTGCCHMSAHACLQHCSHPSSLKRHYRRSSVKPSIAWEECKAYFVNFFPTLRETHFWRRAYFCLEFDTRRPSAHPPPTTVASFQEPLAGEGAISAE
ncbi:hypothetical protein NPIL_405191 [Nephila pilipes]|uniref:Uncharacterized protein n=1 Tax=Nephila pilipes TaxID=299642 RepID=A0A8X6PF31_NEPPI|nr:hypothetical protein NPIL_405191 [Nephila pilipes]